MQLTTLTSHFMLMNLKVGSSGLSMPFCSIKCRALGSPEDLCPTSFD